jgi:uncharacterized integral membrane protein
MSDKGSAPVAQGSDTAPGVGGSLGWLATLVALAIVLLYFVFVVLQWRATGAESLTWSRHEELLTGLQALAFTALGAILGTTAQRQVTRRVQDEARKAEQSAERNARDAEKGRGLQAAIEARSAMVAEGETDVVRGPAASRSFLTELVDIARRYDEPA